MNYTVVNNVYIFKQAVFDSNGKYIHKLNYWYTTYKPHIIKIIQNEFTKLFESNDIKMCDDKLNYIFAFHLYDHYPYAHFFDVTHTLHVVENVSNNCLCMGRKSGVLSIDKHLSILGFNNSLQFNKDQIFNICNLYIPNYNSYGNSLCHYKKLSFNWLRKKYLIDYQYKKDFKSNITEKLYLNRSNKKRHVINETPVLNILKDRGYTIVNGDESLDYIIEVFRNAKVIIGPHGGMFANLLFCTKQPRVIELFPSNYVNRCFESLNKLTETDYMEVICVADEQRNINIDLSLLKGLL